MRLLGLDPGLRITGWGIIDIDGNRMSCVADGAIKTDAKLPLAERLVQLNEGIESVIKRFGPVEAAVEETFVNKNPTSTLKLGQARGVVMLTPARAGLSVFEYTPNQVKKTVVGAGHAQKEQVQMMVKTLLPAAKLEIADAADALAVAICHAQHRNTPDKWGSVS
ncbi:crossover junction endodeoxyribonuclease RuvC [Terasakiella sp. SH-1]|uniref:crossover junction endodeoxyribonuclease RuvC n=1 Tax=Terasakiella sp. SH-1 TaxID=2560057 RepID=UPI0010736DE6|nr:crossover junction endodeoxyribonuclease RuvC [Terasakiella sp. SH-1]